MAQNSLDQLIDAIAGAVVEAESVVRQRQIATLLSYFDAEGRPASFSFRLRQPGAGPDDPLTVLNTPLLSLVPVTSLAIKDLEITFSTELGSLNATPAAAAKPAPVSAVPGTPAQIETVSVAGLAARRATISVSSPVATRAASPSTATVKLHVAAGEPPEGLARLIERLNKLI